MDMQKLKLKPFFVFLMIVSLSVFVLDSCNKKDEKPVYDTSRDGKDPDLYGTWKTSDTTKQEYFEFLKDSTRSCYWLYKDNIRRKYLMAFKVNASGLSFGGFTYPAYKVVGDKVRLFDKNNKQIDSLIRIDNAVINHKTWLQSISILQSFDVPWQFIPPSSQEPMNFGIDGDTLYYYGNNRRIYKYNPFNKMYYDSVDFYTVSSLAFTPTGLFFVSDGKVFKTDRSLKTPMVSLNSANKINTMSIDLSTSTFYYTFDWPVQGLYSAKEGQNPSAVTGFTFLSSTPDGVMYYKDSKFLEFMSGELNMSLFVSGLNAWQKTYDIPEGYDGVYYISTNGSDTWLVVGNYNKNKYQLLKVSID